MTGYGIALGAAAMLALGSGTGQAASLTLTDISAAWVSWSGGSAVTKATDGATSQLRWGIPTGTGKSGYDFTPAATPLNPARNTDFDLGQFTHLNFPIGSGTGIDNATLDVSFSFYLGDDSRNVITRKSQFVFDHWETRNQATPCADGGANGAGVNANGCADRVRAVNNPSRSEAFDVKENGVTTRYSFSVTGFDIGNDFWTTERAANIATLRGRYNFQTFAQPSTPPVPGPGNVPPPAPSPVPLPATGLLLLAGIGALTAAGRRRKPD